MTTRSHIKNARRPQGEEGRQLLEAMNAGTHERLAGWALPFLTIPEGARMLDVGCGGGANLARLRALCPTGHVTGIDYSPVSVAASRDTNAAAIAAGICDVCEGNVSSLPFEDHSFDVATAFETIYFWPDLLAGLKEVARVLAPQGRIFIVNETDGSNMDPERWGEAGDVSDLMRVYSTIDIVRALEQAGFADPSIEHNPETGWICALAVRP